jgi:hypothetical protein
MLSYTGVEATVAFPMQVSDALGYVGVTVIYLVKEFGPAFSYLDFFVICGWLTAAAGAFLISVSAVYFLWYLPRTSIISTMKFERKLTYHDPNAVADVHTPDDKNSDSLASLDILLPDSLESQEKLG